MLLKKKFATHYTINSMKKFIITERFTGYADIEIEADTEQEAIALYNRGHYPDSNYQRDDMFYDFELDSITEAVE